MAKSSFRTSLACGALVTSWAFHVHYKYVVISRLQQYMVVQWHYKPLPNLSRQTTPQTTKIAKIFSIGYRHSPLLATHLRLRTNLVYTKLSKIYFNARRRGVGGRLLKQNTRRQHGDVGTMRLVVEGTVDAAGRVIQISCIYSSRSAASHRMACRAPDRGACDADRVRALADDDSVAALRLSWGWERNSKHRPAECVGRRFWYKADENFVH